MSAREVTPQARCCLNGSRWTGSPQTSARAASSVRYATSPSGRCERQCGGMIHQCLAVLSCVLMLSPLPSPADWPIVPVRIVRGYDLPAEDWLAGHRGIDLRSPADQQVRAPFDGVVRFAGTVVDRGVISLSRSDGLTVTIEPVEALVDTGVAVVRGEVIAVVSQGGHCASSCIHLGVIVAGKYRSPFEVFALPRARLKALTD